MIWFFWAFQQYFFSSLSPPTSSTGSTHRATQDHDTPINLSKPITTHTHTQTQTIKPSIKPHTQTQTIKSSTEPHTQTIKPVRANNGHHTHHPSHRSANPSHRLETHAADLRPSIFETHWSKPIQKKIITGATIGATDDQPTDPPTNQKIHRFKPTINRSKPSSSIHDKRWERGYVKLRQWR